MNCREKANGQATVFGEFYFMVGHPAHHPGGEQSERERIGGENSLEHHAELSESVLADATLVFSLNLLLYVMLHSHHLVI